jgi:hypothetical protein
MNRRDALKAMAALPLVASGAPAPLTFRGVPLLYVEELAPVMATKCVAGSDFAIDWFYLDSEGWHSYESNEGKSDA